MHEIVVTIFRFQDLPFRILHEHETTREHEIIHEPDLITTELDEIIMVHEVTTTVPVAIIPVHDEIAEHEIIMEPALITDDEITEADDEVEVVAAAEVEEVDDEVAVADDLPHRPDQVIRLQQLEQLHLREHEQ
jgi:hypothetical protein